MILISSREDTFDTNHGIGLILHRLKLKMNFDVRHAPTLSFLDAFLAFSNVLIYFLIGRFVQRESSNSSIVMDDWRLIGRVGISQLSSLRLLHIDSRYRYARNRYLRSKNLYNLLKVIFYLVFEKMLFRCIRTVLVSSDDIRAFSSPDMITVIPNGVLPPTSDARVDSELKSAIFYGNMDYAENYECANFSDAYISPILKEHGFSLTIAGTNSHVLKLKNSFVYGKFDDLSSFLAEYDILMSYLLSGAGIKNKVLEAMSHGLIVIGTSLSFDGIVEAQSWKNCIVVSDIFELGAALARLKNMPATQIIEIRNQGVEVAAKYSWEEAIRKYIEFFD